MAQYQNTVDDQILKGLFQQDGGVAKLVEQVLNQILQSQVTEQLKAAPYERTEARQGYRNGTLPHTLTTRVGRLVLRVPRVRNGQFSTELFTRYQRSEQALVLALMEMVMNGVSTRKVAKITEELYGTDRTAYRPAGWGKVERLFRFLDTSFIPEAYEQVEAGHIRTLGELNDAFWAKFDMHLLTCVFLELKPQRRQCTNKLQPLQSKNP